MIDVLIIGSGPAGLAAALGLSRLRRTTFLFDSGVFRNAKAKYAHNYLSRDGVKPAEIRRLGKEELQKKYSEYVTFTDTAAVSVKKVVKDDADYYFELQDATGKTWQAWKLILAVGVTDQMLDIAGFTELWGPEIFPCEFCFLLSVHEESGLSAGVLVHDTPAYTGQTMMVRNFSKDITLFTNGRDFEAVSKAMNGEYLPLLKACDIKVEKRKIKQFEKDPEVEQGLIVTFEDSNQTKLGFLMCAPVMKVNGEFHKQLDLEVDPPFNLIKAAPGMGFQETSCKGCFAAGDCQTLMAQVSNATYSGGAAAAGAVHQLVFDEARRLRKEKAAAT